MIKLNRAKFANSVTTPGGREETFVHSRDYEVALEGNLYIRIKSKRHPDLPPMYTTLMNTISFEKTEDVEPIIDVSSPRKTGAPTK